MESKKLPDPEDISLLGPNAVVQIPDAFADTTKNSRCHEQGIFRCQHNVVANIV